jgi:PAS domain S-box-containing protein
MIAESTTYHFLQGGGELGELTRSFEWDETPLGPIDRWPQSLKTTVGIILKSDFPMFLWWGDEMIQFYNDAYRPSLGTNGKHPSALGQRAEDCWPEIWSIIFPLICQVKETGKSFFSEDQLVPIFRNGSIEDVYWTFSYSAVTGESGGTEGVLVVCNETTKNVVALNEIRRTEKLYKESESNLRNIIIQAPAAMCILKGPKHVVEIANDKMFALWGRSGGDIIHKPLFDALPEATGQGFEQILDSVLESGKTFSASEVPIVLPRDGSTELVYVDFVYEALYKDDGKISGVMVVAFDVTRSVQNKQLLIESEKKYKTLIAESPVATGLYIGSDFKIQYVNKFMTDYWGKDLSVVGLTLAEAVPELKGQPFLDLMSKVYATGEHYIGQDERAMLQVDGRLQEFYFNYTYKALKDSRGEVYGIHHTAVDVTENVINRKSLAQSEKNLRNIIQQSPVAMCLLKGISYKVEIINDLVLAIWGKLRVDVENKPLFEGLPEAKAQGLEELLNYVYTTGKPFIAYERPIDLLENGKLHTKYLNFVYEAFREGNGEISGIMVVAIEVTDQVLSRQKIEEVVTERTLELAESNKNLRRSNEDLAQFAYIASHDLQEPARKIKTFSEMLRKTLGSVDPRSTNYLQKIESSSSRMLTLIRDVLTFSQIARAKQEFIPVDLNNILQSVKEDFELVIQEKGALIKSENLPVVLGLPVQISQLFNNLVSNALKFSVKETKPEIRVTVSRLTHEQILDRIVLSLDKNYYQISFTDNGIGFNQSNASQIFDIFQRLHGKDEYEGTGIGLAMCKKICQNHNGDIYAESSPGRGATFNVILPMTS